VLGKALKDLPRDKIIVSTKVGHHASMHIRGNSGRSIAAAAEPAVKGVVSMQQRQLQPSEACRILWHSRQMKKPVVLLL
jgi:aryl-alcohol dehydrogenase-like predicted oxidoreductase